MSIEFNDISINTGVFRKSTIASHDRFNVVLEEQKVLFLGSKNRLIPIEKIYFVIVRRQNIARGWLTMTINEFQVHFPYLSLEFSQSCSLLHELLPMGFKEKSNLSLVFRRIVIQPTHFSKNSQEFVFE